MTSAFRRQRAWWLFLLIIGLSLALKLAVWQMVRGSDPARFLRPDSVGYMNSARALWEIGRFAVAPDLPNEPQLFRTPGYPFFLAAVYAISGRDDATTAIFVQILLSIIVMGVAYWLALRLWTQAVALLALALLALDLPSFAYSLLLMSETLFTLFLLLTIGALYQVDRLSPTQRWWRLALAGLILGIATLTRPVSYYMVIPVAAWLLWLGWRQQWSWRMIGLSVLLFVLPYCLLVGSWQWRNYRLTGMSTISTVVETNLLLYRGAGILALRDGLPLETEQEQLKAQLSGLEGRDLYRTMEEEGLAIIRQYPWLAMQTQVRGALTMLLGLGDGWLTMLFYSTPEARSAAWDLLRLPFTEYLQQWIYERPIPFIAFWIAAAQLILVYVGIGCWWLLALRRPRQIASIHVLLAMILLYFVAIAAGPEANSRFRVPLAPLLTGYAAAGFYLLSMWLRNAKFFSGLLRR